MSDDVTDGFQTYEDAVQAHMDAKNGQNAVTFALVGLGIGPNLHDNRRNALAVGFQQCSLMLAKPVAEVPSFRPGDDHCSKLQRDGLVCLKAQGGGRERQKVGSRPVPAANAAESVLGDRELLRSPGWINKGLHKASCDMTQ
jgi:hypothetical protein